MNKIERSGTYWGIVAGDRVAVTGEKERDRGKIGIVREVRREAEEVVVERINLVCSDILFYPLALSCFPLQLGFRGLSSLLPPLYLNYPTSKTER